MLIYCLICLAALTAAVLLLIFLIIPLLKGLFSPLPTVRYTPSSFVTSVTVDEKPTDSEADFSSAQHEAKLSYSTVSDPYLYGDSLVFSTASMVKGVQVYNNIIVYNINTEEEKKLNISVQYENLINFVMNDDYIVWCDAQAENGGRICGYDRKSGTQFKIKDYVYAAPKLSLSGNILAFMQQAGDETDRLYLYDLVSREAVTYKVFQSQDGLPTQAHIYGDILCYAIPSDKESGYAISLVNVKTGEENVIETGKSVRSPKTNGKDVAFLSSTIGAPTDLYVMSGDDAILIASDVLNFDMCDAGVVYSKDECVYLYMSATKQSMRLNTNISRAYLAEADGDNICWYDITGGYNDSADIVRYIKVSELNV